MESIVKCVENWKGKGDNRGRYISYHPLLLVTVGEIMSDDTKIADETLAICSDLAIYFAEVLRRNKSDILYGMNLSEYQQEVSDILIDLAKTDTMNKSSQYADNVVSEMKRKIQLVPNAHRFAGFVVLKSPNIPSVLLEMGYLSNREEEKLMWQKSYRNKLSQALVNAVNQFFKDNP